jgi:hypothetical protein
VSNGRTILIAVLSAFATAIVLAAAAHSAPSPLELRALKAVAAVRRPVALAALPTPEPPQHRVPPVAAAPVAPPPPAAPPPEPAATEAAPTPTPTPTATPTPTPRHSAAGHVFVIALTGPGYQETFGPDSPAPYLKELRDQGVLLSGFGPADAADLPNYLAFAGGLKPNAKTRGECASYADGGCVVPNTVLSLGDQVSASGQAWRAYMEGMGDDQTCVHPDNPSADPTLTATSGYVTRHDPFVYFHSLLDLGDCLASVHDLTALGDDLKVPRLTPNLTFIAPDVCHSGTVETCEDGTPAGLAAADAFLAEWVPKITASKAFKKDGVLVIAFLSHAGGGTDPTGAVVVAPRFAHAGGLFAKPFDAYSLLRTVEDLLALEPLGKAARAASFAKLALPLAFSRR